MTREQHTFCRICEAHCGLVVGVDEREDEERIVRIRPDRDHPVSKGYACLKGTGAGGVHHDPARLNHPLKRVGDGFERVTWKEAIDEIGSAIRTLVQAHGPRAIAMYRGNPSFFSFQHVLYASAFMEALGSPNLYTSVSIDSNPKFFVATEMFGQSLVQPVPDVRNTELFVCLGSNPFVSQMSIVSMPNATGRLREVVARGGRVVTIDPRRTETARRVGEHLFIQPGSDVYLLLAMLHVVAADGVNATSLRAFANGVDEFLALGGPWTPRRAAALTGIPAGTIVDLARSFRDADGACLYMSTGLNMGPFGSLCYWLIQGLSLVCGQLDRRGGLLVPDGAFDLVGLYQQLESPEVLRRRTLVSEFPSVSGAFPIAALAEEIEAEHPQRVRALIVSSGNPLHSVPGDDLSRAFDRLELRVAIDLYLSETAQRCDWVFPATDMLEHSDFPLGWMLLQERPYAQFTEAVVEPKFERRDEWRIFSDLAVACGLPAFGPTVCNVPPRLNALLRRLPGSLEFRPDHLLALLLKLGGKTSLKELRANPSGVLMPPNRPGTFLGRRVPTPDGRVQLVPPKITRDLARAEAFAKHRRAPDSLRLIGLRERKTHNSWFHNHPGVKQPAGNTARMHPSDAAKRGISDGSEIEIDGGATVARLPVKLTDELCEGVIAVPHGWGHSDSGNDRARSLAGEKLQPHDSRWVTARRTAQRPGDHRRSRRSSPTRAEVKVQDTHRFACRDSQCVRSRVVKGMSDKPVVHEPRRDGGVFAAERDGKRSAELTYRNLAQGTVVVDHTFVDPSVRGTGAGLKLLQSLVDWARRSDVRVRATCSFAVAMFEKHADLRDVYDP